MSIRNHTPALLILATLTGCAMAPAHADAMPQGYVPGQAFDLPITGRLPIAAPSAMTTWRGAPRGWNPPGLDGPGRGGGGGRPGTYGKGCKRGKPCRPEPPIPHDLPGAPGPLPVLGAAAAWGWARRLRSRIR